MLLKSENIICPITGASTGASSEHANPVGASVLVYRSRPWLLTLRN